MKNNESEITTFINEFSKFGEPVINAFTQGCCYWFAYILVGRFSGLNPSILMLPVEGHFVTEICGELYDIEGNVSKKYKNSPKEIWKDYQKYEPKHARRIMRDCFYKI